MEKFESIAKSYKSGGKKSYQVYKKLLDEHKTRLESIKNHDIEVLKISDNTLKNLLNWSYNIQLLDIYMLYEEYINGIVQKLNTSKTAGGNLYDLESGVVVDEIVDIINEMRIIWGFVEPAVRKKTYKRAIGVIRNIYTGFDTEYENVNIRYNDLLSVQIAVCSELTVRVPVYTDFKIHSIDTLTGEKYPQKALKHKLVRETIIEELIDERLRCIRHTKLGNNDVFMAYLTNVLDTLSFNGIIRKVNMSDKEYNYYLFDKSNITKWFKVTSSFTLAHLVKQSTQMADKDLNESELKFDEFLQNCVDGIDNKEITFNDTLGESVTLDERFSLEVPRRLITVLDKYYKGSKLSGNYVGEFMTEEEQERSEVLGESYSDVKDKE